MFGDDGDFSWERFDERYNADLANNLGNLVSRVTAMAHQYRQGRLVPDRRDVGAVAETLPSDVVDGISASDGRARRFTSARAMCFA